MLENDQEPSMPSKGIWTLFDPEDVNTGSSKQESTVIQDGLSKDKPCCSLGKIRGRKIGCKQCRGESGSLSSCER